MRGPTKVILDTDPGYDDAVAILMALGSPAFDVLGITVVAGNATVERTFHNARRLVDFTGAGVPVFRGCDRPLLRALVTAPHVHGETGLDGVDLAAPSEPPQEQHAVLFLVDTLRRAPEPVRLITLGPLTNVALALRLAPDVRERIGRIVMMGGSACGGNVTPAAEFNIYVDPDAAKIVLESGVPITMVGLDVTHRAVFTREDIAALAAGGPGSRLAGRILSEYAERLLRLGRAEGARLHDPLALAVAVDPSLVRTRHVRVEVETTGELTVGQTVVDLDGVSGKPANADVAVEVDAVRFKQFVFDALAGLDARLAGRTV